MDQKFDRVEREVNISAPASAVFSALTEARKLGAWFAEHATIEPRVGGRYAFWGKYTFPGTEEASATQRILSFKPGEELIFDWNYMGTPSIMTVSLVERDGETRVVALHAMPQNNVQHRYWEAVDSAEYWLYNLKSYCENGSPMLRTAYSELCDPVHLEITIDAPADDVFHALTDPVTMNDWISSGAAVDLRVGGDYRYGWTFEQDGEQVPGGPRKVLEYEPGRRLLTDWFYGDEPETRCEWIVEGAGGRTTVKLTHSGFGASKTVPDYQQGWASFLCILKSKMEGKDRVRTPEAVATA